MLFKSTHILPAVREFLQVCLPFSVPHNNFLLFPSLSLIKLSSILSIPNPELKLTKHY